MHSIELVASLSHVHADLIFRLGVVSYNFDVKLEIDFSIRRAIF